MSTSPTDSTYRAPRWLPGGHAQTIWPLLRKGPMPAFQRERWTTPDGDFIDESGTVTRGQEALENKYAEFFTAHHGAKMTIAIDSLRALGPDTVVEDGHATVGLAKDAPATSSAGPNAPN